MRHHVGILKCRVSLKRLFKSKVYLEDCKGLLKHGNPSVRMLKTLTLKS